MGTWLCASFSQPRKSEKIGQFAMTGSFALESLCFQFTRCSYSTFFSSFVRTKLTYCVSTVQTIACMRRETVFLQLAAEWENAVSKKTTNSEVKLSSTELIYHQIDIFGS